MKQGKKKMSLRNKLLIALGAILCVVIVCLATAYGTFLHYYNKMNITSVDDDYEIVTQIDYDEDDIIMDELTEEEIQQLNELVDYTAPDDEEGDEQDSDGNTVSSKEDGKKTSSQEDDKTTSSKEDGKKTSSKEDGKNTSSQDDTSSKDGTSSQDNTQDTAVKVSSKDVTNILLLGTDSRKGGNRRSRTDTMVILSIDKKNKRLIMTSILRDSYVKIPGVGNNRLNAAFVYGGPKLLFNTINTNFGIKLDKYVQVDFYNFIKVVDAVGGVDMNLTAAEIKVMNKTYIPYINKSLKKKAGANLIKQTKGGNIHLNGVQALAYTRVRYVGTDFARTERQRKVMTQIIKRTKKLSAGEISKLADIVLPMVSTNLSKGEVMSLVLNAKEYLNYKVVQGRMPINGSYKYMKVRGASVIGVDFKKNKKYWYKLVYNKSV